MLYNVLLVSAVQHCESAICTHTHTHTHIYTHTYIHTQASLVAQGVKNLPAMQETQETWVQSLEMATHSSIIAWGIQWTKEPLSEPGGRQSMASQRVGHN